MRKSLLTTSFPFAAIGLFLAMIAMALFMGLLASTGNIVLVGLATAFIAALALVAFPYAMLWIVVIGGLLAGLADLYLPEVRQVRWGVVIAALGLSAVSIGVGMLQQKRSKGPYLPIVWSPPILWALVFFLTTVLSAFVNHGFALDSIIGLKGYFQVWGIMLAFALLPLCRDCPDRFMKMLFIIATIQIPFVLHQHFVLVPKRSMDALRGLVSQDIIVGTFAGSMTGGGAGAAMAILLIIAMTAILGLWRAGKLSMPRLVLLSSVFLLPLAIGEHKISVILLPVALFLVFEDKIRRNPFIALGMVVTTAAIVAILFMAFSLLPRTGTTRDMSPAEYLDETLSYNIGDQGYGNAILNRTSVYQFWLNNHQSGTYGAAHTLVGYGPGASKSAIGGIAERSLAEQQYSRYAIGLTGLSGLLWDVGLLGTFSALGFLISSFMMARRHAAKLSKGNQQWIYLKMAEVGIAVITISLLHNNMFLYEIGFQTILMLLIGYALFTKRAEVENGPVHR